MPLTLNAHGRFFLQLRSSLATQLYGLVACLTLAAWATFYWGHLDSEASGLENVRLHASTLSLAYAENLERTLESTDNALIQAGARWLQDPARTAEADGQLSDLLAGHSFRVSLLAPKGEMHSTGGGPAPIDPAACPLDPGAMPSYAAMNRLLLRVPGPQPGVQTREIVQIVRPLFQQQQLAGVIALCVEPAFLTKFSRKLDLAGGTTIAVLGSDGQLIAHAPDGAPNVRPLWVDRAARTAPSAVPRPLMETVSDEESEHTVGIYRVPKYGVAVLVGVDTAHQMAPDRNRKHVVSIFAALFPLLLVLATRMILQSLARRESLEKSMRDSERLAASVFTHAREGIIITDVSGLILDVNSTFSHITGFAREEVLGRTPAMLQSDRQSPEFYAAMRNDLFNKGHWSGDLWSHRRNGDLFAALLTISAVRDAADVAQHFVALFTDITEIKDHQRQLAHMAHYDSLSSLPNRVLLADRLRQAMLQCQRRKKLLAVAFLDLDGFKEVNDQHGHDVGDALLVAVAQNLKAALRDGDTLARIGGDEFVAVMADLDHQDECYSVLERLLTAAHLKNTIHHPQGSDSRELLLQVSTSIGFTFYPQQGVDADQLLRQADQAMYQAKQAGKNRYHLFDVAYDAALKTRTESIERIRQALANEEFVLYYQPKVNMKSGQVIGAEALIRWIHPERGLLAPLQFLPIIENHLLGIALGEWVIHTALHQIERWQSQGLDLCVSVNISSLQLHQESFAPRLSNLLAAYPMVRPEQLELEILETSAMEDMAKVTENIRLCHALGVRFALDDFGTGYSSLTYLKRLPAEILKIDQSFVRDMLEDADDLAIVQSIIGLAQTFHRTVIAEGVETSAHGDLLMKLGCDLAQGYGIAKPMPSENLPAWVLQWQRENRV